MSKYISVFISAVLLIIIFLITSCKKEDNPVESESNPVSTGPIKTGDVVQVASKDIGSSGGTISVTDANSPVKGLTITVPQNGYSDTRTYNVSYATINSHSLGSNFNPISPIITIKNGGGYSSEVLSVKVPIKKNKDEFAMGFYYDQQTGKLEGLPLLSLTDSSIVVGTRHFSTSNISTSASLHKSTDAASLSNIIITSVKESFLTGQGVISTGFKPEKDGWEFVNNGSYLEPDGHCAGQSISSMWYYYEKKLKGESNLFHRFDKYFVQGHNGDSLWMDNRNGFRFASMVQNSIDWGGMIRKVFVKMRENSSYNSLSWKAFALSMLITGEPQYVGLKSADGAHAIVAHKISLTENKLYVTDPNFPGQERVITYNGVTFNPYSTKQNAKELNAHSYTDIGYFSKTCLIEWSTVGQLYQDLLSGVSGETKFPAYSLLMKNGNNLVAFNDGAVLEKDTLNLVNKSIACEQYLNGTSNLQQIEIYDTTGKKIATGDFGKKGIATIKLKSGANKYGLYIMGARNNDPANYVDFKWVTVYYQSLSIDPNPLQGEPTKEYKLTARSKGTAPKGNSKYVWTFGDNTSQATVTNDSTITHTYNAEGNFNVKVELYENSTNKKLLEATATANIVKPSDLLKQLKTMNKLTEDCSFSYVNQVGYTTTEAFNVLAVTSKDSITWSGTNFTYSYQTLQDYSANGSKANYYTTVSGQVASDAKSILEITYFHKIDYFEYYKASETQTRKMTFKNVPMTKYPGYQEWGSGTIYNYFVYEFDNAASKSNVTYLEYRWSLDPQFDIVGVDKIKNFSTPLKITFIRK